MQKWKMLAYRGVPKKVPNLKISELDIFLQLGKFLAVTDSKENSVESFSKNAFKHQEKTGSFDSPDCSEHVTKSGKLPKAIFGIISTA